MVLPTAYLPPLSYMEALMREPATIEQMETFEKQTFRNRAIIRDTKDELVRLTIPVKKVEHKQLTRDIEISYQSRWQHQHWISLVSTYKNTPYFDYYEEFFKPFYEKEYRFLWDFNSEIHETIMALMRNERPSEVSLQKSAFRYRCTADWRGEDLNRFFGDGKSILDELFEYGPETTDHLR